MTVNPGSVLSLFSVRHGEKSLSREMASPYHGCQVDTITVLPLRWGNRALKQMSSLRSHKQDLSFGDLTAGAVLTSLGNLSWLRLMVIGRGNGESSKPRLKLNVHLTEECSLPRKWHHVFVIEHRPGQAGAGLLRAPAGQARARHSRVEGETCQRGRPRTDSTWVNEPGGSDQWQSSSELQLR